MPAHAGFHIEARDAVFDGEVMYGHAITLLAQDPESHARRLVAQLLNAGWTPPDVSALRRRDDRSSPVTAAQLAPVPLDTRRTL